MRTVSVVVVGWRGRASLVAVLFVGVCLAPASAVAGSYHDFLCRIPYGPEAGRPAPVEDVAFGFGSYLYGGDSCAEGGSLYAAMDGEVSHPWAVGAWGAFEAPAGLTIAGFTVWRYDATEPEVDYGTPQSKLEYVPGPASVGVPCTGRCSHGTLSEPLSPENAVSQVGLSGVRLIRWDPPVVVGKVARAPRLGLERSLRSTTSTRRTSISSTTLRRASATLAARWSRAAR